MFSVSHGLVSCRVKRAIMPTNGQSRCCGTYHTDRAAGYGSPRQSQVSMACISSRLGNVTSVKSAKTSGNFASICATSSLSVSLILRVCTVLANMQRTTCSISLGPRSPFNASSVSVLRSSGESSWPLTRRRQTFSRRPPEQGAR